MGLFLRRFSSRSDIRFRLYLELSSLTLTSRTPLASSFTVYPACSVHPTVRTFASCQCSRAHHVALYPATFQRLTRYFLSSSRFLHLSLSSLLSLFLFSFSFSVSISLSAVFLSCSYSTSVFLSKIIFSFFWLSSRQLFFDLSVSYTLLISYSLCISSKTLIQNITIVKF